LRDGIAETDLVERERRTFSDATVSQPTAPQIQADDEGITTLWLVARKGNCLVISTPSR